MGGTYWTRTYWTRTNQWVAPFGRSRLFIVNNRLTIDYQAHQVHARSSNFKVALSGQASMLRDARQTQPHFIINGSAQLKKASQDLLNLATLRFHFNQGASKFACPSSIFLCARKLAGPFQSLTFIRSNRSRIATMHHRFQHRTRE